jgi:ATP-dependent protease HslVU (ClpYQ) ATPase subunit
VLLTGSTGSGKSSIAAAVAEAAGGPFLRVAANELTEAGWSGVQLADLLNGWPGAELGWGVIQIDEVDKVTADEGTVGNSKSKYTKQMASLLPLLGREPVLLSGGRTVETDCITVICTGAFSSQPWSMSGMSPTTQQLTAAGVLVELADRLELRIAVPPHTASNLARLYRRQLTGEFRGIRTLAHQLGYRLRIAGETYTYIAEAAVSRAAGSREGRGWLELACQSVIGRALEEHRPPGTLIVSPDDVRVPSAPEQPRHYPDDTPGPSAWV